MNDWFVSLMIAGFFVLGFWLGALWILEKEKNNEL
tara:strand:- start:210 stop:314 length:105 start_codon:yes stop_codon:yes gene_type:complete